MEWIGIHLWMERVRAGDQDAWTSLYRLSLPLLLSEAGQLLGENWQQRSVRDLIQETWLKVVVGLDAFRGGRGDADTGPKWRDYLLTIIQRVAANEARAGHAEKRKPPGRLVSLDDGSAPDASRARRDQLPAAGPTPSHDLRMQDQGIKIREALQALDADERLVIEMAFFGGLSFPQIATQTSLSHDQIRSRFHKALARLGRSLDGLV